ncbi:S-methyl-5-thioribose kinase [Clostridium sp. MB40-C1]|uniref:S-methyl-5-thioribose kinase n=1 Tax=Clostridium sp. MB40-C1 TaxID=3070996 RepID=UPI0027E1E5B2|nr:S-methyl-5-thioribose kinase [Clostridium sp. MB40-C1]WMJ80926.1 S-methyl-5-thioribose kinase [Clostridium sp. MB40-C1]
MADYNEMSSKSIVEYIRNLNLNIFYKGEKLKAEEIGDGNLNLVFRIKGENSGKSVIVKQALPYLRIAGEGWKLTLDRNRIEAEAMFEQEKACNGFVPKIYKVDKDNCLYVAEDLGYMDILRTGFMEMKRYPNLSKQMGKFLSRNLFYTSDLGLGSIKKKKMISKFINPELCDITEKLVLTDPYINAESNDINSYIIEDAKRLWENEKVRLEISKLKNLFMTKAEALLHGDLHTGSIFVSLDRIVIFDTEFAFYGPYGYDIGLLFANYILNYFSWEGRKDKSKKQIEDFREYLLESIKEIWNEFKRDFGQLWDNDSKEIITEVKGYKEYYINNLLHETIGFASCEIMRRVLGMAHVPDLDFIKNEEERAEAQRLALNIAQEMLIRRNEINSIDGLVKLIKEQI